MEKIDIKFLFKETNNLREAEPGQVGVQNGKQYFNFLYENYADKVLGFIIQHNYPKEDAEEILIRTLIKFFEDVNEFEQTGKLLLKMMGIAANLICKEKSVKYQHVK